MLIRIFVIALLLNMLTMNVFAFEQVYDLYANDGTYLGNTSSNQFDSNSINNPYGKYGSEFSSNSIRNQFGQYGSKFSQESPNNRFAQPGTAVPQYGGTAKQFGGNSYY